MKAKDMRNKSPKELQKDLTELRAKLATTQVEYRTKEVKNVRSIRAIRRDIARTLTTLHQQATSTKGEQS